MEEWRLEVWDDVVDQELAELLDGGYDEPTPPECECCPPEHLTIYVFGKGKTRLGVCNACQRLIT